jgi:uncharacterized membrane protein YjjB (DUF3815 family)
MTLVQIFEAWLWSFGASACFAVFFNAEKRDIVLSAVLGSIGWIVYLAFKSGGGAESIGYFAGAFSVAVFAEILAIVLHRPATVYLIPGITPLVPGGGIFFMMRGVVRGEFSEALSAGYEALATAVAIALGIAIASSTARIVAMAVKGKQRKLIEEMDMPVQLPEDVDNPPSRL